MYVDVFVYVPNTLPLLLMHKIGQLLLVCISALFW